MLRRRMGGFCILVIVFLVLIGVVDFRGLVWGSSFRCCFFVIGVVEIGFWEVFVGLEFDELYLFLFLFISGGDCELFEIKGFLFLFWFLL